MALSIIHDMARLLLMNPAITARELAAKMGYAEEKSVYYWLQKSGFSGMRDFRRRVLSRQFAVNGPLLPETENDLVHDRTATGRPTEGREKARELSFGISQEEFWHLPVYNHSENTNNDYSLGDYLGKLFTHESFGIVAEKSIWPWILPGDLVIVDPLASPNQGDLFALGTGKPLILARRYALADNAPIWVDAENPERMLNPEQVTGKVISIIKNMWSKGRKNL